MWGTKEYFAPEVIDQAYGPQADVWALGCVLFEMLSGQQAFPVKDHDTESKFYGRISKGEYDTSGPAWKHVSPEAKELLGHMLTVDPVARWSASECLLHPWVQGKQMTEAHQRPLTEVTQAMRMRLERKNRKK